MANSIIPIGADHGPALHTLVRKRAEFDGELQLQQDKVRDLQRAIANIDAVLVLLKPDIKIDEIAPRRARPRYAAAPGEITGIVVDCLREADGPLTSRALAAAVIEARDLDPTDVKLEIMMAKRVRACLRPLRLAGRVRAISMTEGPQGWVLTTKSFRPVADAASGTSR